MNFAAPSPTPPLPSGYTPRPSPVPPSPFLLTLGKDDTALFQDTRIGFSHLLPGRPAIAQARAGDPAADATVSIQDAPITVRYRLEPPTMFARTAAELAKVTAEHYGSFRAQAAVNADLANESWLGAWGVEGAAVATYPLAYGTIREDLFVLVREGMVLFVTWSTPTAFVDDPSFAAFVAVAEATLVWERARWEQRGRVWPASELVEPGLFGAPKPKHDRPAQLLRGVALDPTERARLVAMLSGISASAGAPWKLLSDDVRDASRRALLGTTREPQVLAFLESAFADVVTAQDLRGLAVILGRALG